MTLAFCSPASTAPAPVLSPGHSTHAGIFCFAAAEQGWSSTLRCLCFTAPLLPARHARTAAFRSRMTRRSPASVPVHGARRCQGSGVPPRCWRTRRMGLSRTARLHMPCRAQAELGEATCCCESSRTRSVGCLMRCRGRPVGEGQDLHAACAGAHGGTVIWGGMSACVVSVCVPALCITPIVIDWLDMAQSTAVIQPSARSQRASLAQGIPSHIYRRRCTAPSRAAAPSRAPLLAPSAGAGEPRAGLAAPAPTLPISSWYSSGSTFSLGSTNSAKIAKPAAAQVLSKRAAVAAAAVCDHQQWRFCGGLGSCEGQHAYHQAVGRLDERQEVERLADLQTSTPDIRSLQNSMKAVNPALLQVGEGACTSKYSAGPSGRMSSG